MYVPCGHFKMFLLFDLYRGVLLVWFTIAIVTTTAGCSYLKAFGIDFYYPNDFDHSAAGTLT